MKAELADDWKRAEPTQEQQEMMASLLQYSTPI